MSHRDYRVDEEVKKRILTLHSFVSDAEGVADDMRDLAEAGKPIPDEMMGELADNLTNALFCMGAIFERHGEF